MYSIYVSEEHHLAIVTVNRTGSSHLHNIATDLPEKLVSAEPTRELSHLQILEDLQKKNYDLYLTIKDPTERRKSALQLIAHTYDTAERNIMYLKGQISAIHENVRDTALPHYAMCNSHLDWGASVLYHVFKQKGLKFKPCLLNRSDVIWNDHPDYLFPVNFQTYKNSIPTLTSISELILGKNLTPTYITGTVNIGEALYKLEERAVRDLLYDTWCLEFRKIMHISSKPLVLTLDEFVSFEHRCHDSIIREHLGSDNFESTEDLLNWAIEKYTSHPEMPEIIRYGEIYSGSTPLNLVDKYKEFVLNCLHKP